MCGLELCKGIAAERPGIKVLVMSVRYEQVALTLDPK